MNLFQLALEGAEPTGTANKEIEHVYYANITDLSFLEGVAVEHQEQWAIVIPKTEDNKCKGNIRVRATHDGASESDWNYIFTTKTFDLGAVGKTEVELTTTKDHFEQFKLLAEKGMRKDRYVIPIEGTDLKWEIDFFLTQDSKFGERKYHPWVKIDIEVTSANTVIPEFPFPTNRIITEPFGKRTEEDERLVTSLYDDEFVTRNK